MCMSVFVSVCGCISLSLTLSLVRHSQTISHFYSCALAGISSHTQVLSLFSSQFYVDKVLVGSVKYPISSPGALPALDPPEMMLGCHKDATNPTYLGFNTASYDELAIWDKALVGEKTMYFMGTFGKCVYACMHTSSSFCFSSAELRTDPCLIFLWIM